MPPPISSYIRKLREDRGIMQNKAADLLGYEQSYISSVEKGHKAIKNTGLVAKIIERYQLSGQEKFQIRHLLGMSSRERTIPHDATEKEFFIFNRFCDLVNNKNLDPKIANALMIVLDVADEMVTIKRQKTN